MNTFTCKKCGSIDIFIKANGTQTGLYCSDCGAWLKWIGKDEQRLAELQINRLKNNPMPEVKPPKNENISIDLSKVSNEDLMAEVKRRMEK